jgi:peptidoglycan/LPS O-acetylase OafA/YrhL
MAITSRRDLFSPKSQPDRSERFYLPELDSLRFFAFLAVFVCHAWDIQHGPNPLADIGTFGVDLFFTLSAYLITELLLRERERLGEIDVPAFYIRRILRIWPLYFAFLAVVFVAVSLWPLAKISWLYFAACSVFVGNFGFYWLGQPSLIIAPLWSISVEEQFYISWPLILRRLTQRKIVIAAILLWTFSIAVRWLMAHEGARLLIVFGTFGRLDPMACGILLSAFQRSGRWRNPPLIVRVILVIVGCYLWLMADLWRKPA